MNPCFVKFLNLTLNIIVYSFIFLTMLNEPAIGLNHRSGYTMQTNRLISEKSPYLLQHADNPVNWYPWGDEAFQKALTEDKPIFLSIGYSTCHWCHVMEHESFEDEKVAALLNETFICIKVDREERPDIDSVYMTVCQMLTGSGGWPLTIFMTAEKKPFYAATYIPKESRFGRTGMLELIPQVKHIWQTDRKPLFNSIDNIMSAVDQQNLDHTAEDLEDVVFANTYEIFKHSFDEKYGGFGNAPKFPTPHNLLFLLRYWKRTGNDNALNMVTKTLRMMRGGGIYDHLGYGFHRYSTDKKWLAPHFEKMLYDQALISMVYLEAFQATADAAFSKTAVEIFSYIENEMTSPEGGFYSAEDADSEGVEGKFYVWKIEEIKELFTNKEADLLIDYFNLDPSGNFQNEATGSKSGDNILNVDILDNDFYEKYTSSVDEFKLLLNGYRNKMLEKRSLRVRPFKDDKILTDWNGLMIAALAKGGRVLDRPELTVIAEKAAAFINTSLAAKSGGLLHVYREGSASVSAQLDDYAFFTWGLLELYETTFNTIYLKQAISLNQYMTDNFWDKKNGGFFATAHDAEKLIMRQKDSYDGAVPSGNSVALLNIIKLARITSNSKLEKYAEKLFRSFAAKVEQVPSGHTMFLSAFDFIAGPSCEVVIAGQTGAEDVSGMLKALRSIYLPNKVVLFHPEGVDAKEIEQICNYIKPQKSLAGKATAYICESYTCKKPVTEIEQMTRLLMKKKD